MTSPVTVQTTSSADISALLDNLEAPRVGGRAQGNIDRLVQLRRMVAAGAIQTLEPLLPLCLTLNGKPYELSDHYPFSPMFRTAMPKKLLLKTGRQVSKSTSVAALGVMTSNAIPYFKTLYVMPRYEQVRRFSNNYVRPFIDRSAVRSLWSGTSVENSVLQRTFRNLSMMLFSFALLDADRVRGVSADAMYLDEVQDMDPDHIPIIREAMSHSDFGLERLTGTPKTLDGAVETNWGASSQAEWFIPCYSCGRWNIPSMEFHVFAMIGELRDNISERNPGTVCHYCRKPIFPRHGHWVHRYPERRWSFAGYHVPQIIMPLHYAKREKWAELLAKQRGWGNTTHAMFCNEVLGESIDSGQKLISKTQLQAAAVLPWQNNPNRPDATMMSQLDNYKLRVLGVDWGGGGEEGVSFTTMCVLGLTPAGQIHCLWGKRLIASQEHLREAVELLHWVQAFRCHLVAHDYTGAGVVRETVMVQAGFDLERVMAMQYVRAASSNLLKFVPPSVLHNRGHYRIDKTRSLLYTFQAIKLKLLRFFKYDHINDDEPGLLHDFLALIEEKNDRKQASDIYTIIRSKSLIDDFAHAVNLAAAAIWHSTEWPNFAEAAAIGRITMSQLMAYGSRDYGWEQDQMGGFMNQP